VYVYEEPVLRIMVLSNMISVFLLIVVELDYYVMAARRRGSEGEIG
jgi:hypothetical protein